MLNPKKVDCKRNMDIEMMKYPQALGNTGSSFRLERAISKGIVRIVFLGASVTMGYTGSTVLEETFCDIVSRRFEEGFNCRVEHHYCGMSGTCCAYGLYIVESEVEMLAPDIVFCEYAVNNARTLSGIRLFEGLIRRLLSLDSKPSVVPVSVAMEGGYSCEDYINDIAVKYSLSAVNIAGVLRKGIEENHFSWHDYSGDNVHPNSWGHSLIADCISDVLHETIEKGNKSNNDMPKPIYGGNFCSIRIQSNAEMKGFIFSDGYYINDICDKSYEHYIKICGIMQSGCAVIEVDNSDEYGCGEVFINGEEQMTINTKSIFGWKNPQDICLFDFDKPGQTEIVIRMAKNHHTRYFKISILCDKSEPR